MTLQITHVSYMFLSLLPAMEPLVSRGQRLQDTPNTGTQAISEIWLVGGEDDEIWVDQSGSHETGTHRIVPLLRLLC